MASHDVIKCLKPFEWIWCDTFKDLIVVVIKAFVAGNPRRKRRGRGEAKTRTSAASGQAMQTVIRLRPESKVHEFYNAGGFGKSFLRCGYVVGIFGNLALTEMPRQLRKWNLSRLVFSALVNRFTSSFWSGTGILTHNPRFVIVINLTSPIDQLFTLIFQTLLSNITVK